MSDADNVAAAGQGVVNAAIGLLSTQEQKDANQKNYEIALRNLGLSEEQMRYMRELQNISWQRDDNAISRMVKDLRNNGFNKLLAFGTGGLSNTTVSQPSAPQLEYRYQPIDYSALKQNLIGTIADMENLKNIRTQRELMENQAYGQTLNNILTQLKAREDAYNLDYYSSKGLPTNASGLPKVGAEVQGMVDKHKESAKEFVDNLIKQAQEKQKQKKREKQKEKMYKEIERDRKKGKFWSWLERTTFKPDTNKKF